MGQRRARGAIMNRGRKPKFKEPPLQPLRIPTGWLVEWNTFFDAQPPSDIQDDLMWEFSQDMLLISNEWVGVVLELGWYPTLRRGSFGLVALRKEKIRKLAGLAWDDPERELITR